MSETDRAIEKWKMALSNTICSTFAAKYSNTLCIQILFKYRHNFIHILCDFTVLSYYC